MVLRVTMCKHSHNLLLDAFKATSAPVQAASFPSPLNRKTWCWSSSGDYRGPRMLQMILLKDSSLSSLLVSPDDPLMLRTNSFAVLCSASLPHAATT